MDALFRLQLAKRSLHGLALGDAFGQTFFAKEESLDVYFREGQPAPAPWTYTDDSVMALSIVEELAEHGFINQDRLAKRFADRYRVEPHRGYGGGAHWILRKIGEGANWRIVAADVFEGQGSLGNGAAMRSAPLGAYFFDNLDQVVKHARLASEVTHMHPDGIAGGIAIALAAAFASRHRFSPQDRPEEELIPFVQAHLPESDTRAKLNKAIALPFSSRIETAVSVLGNGSRVLATDTVPFTLWCAARHWNDWPAALWETVSGLGDRDTTCAIVSAILACHLNPEDLPSQWWQNLEPLPAHLQPEPEAKPS
ncbi:MAG: ADP-ribosylglycohydrolase family protein [Acidobacteria bacterium]|nr:ADP-ribosylglycohydrolase family protein [Acidobacteriota bacterium]